MKFEVPTMHMMRTAMALLDAFRYMTTEERATTLDLVENHICFDCGVTKLQPGVSCHCAVDDFGEDEITAVRQVPEDLIKASA